MPRTDTERIRQVLTFNTTGKVRREKWHGRDFLVTEGVMITRGVHKGNQGPVLYDEEFLNLRPSSWDMKPMVVYHPTNNGVAITACDPDVLEKQGVGHILRNKTVNSGVPRWKPEMWFDEERIQKVDDRIYEKLLNEEPIEGSTGLELVVSRENGEFNGKKYKLRALDYSPDHFAVFADKKGACSVQDGGGVFANEEGEEKDDIEKLKTDIKDFGQSENKAKTKRQIMERAESLGRMDLIPSTWRGAIARNEMQMMVNDLSFSEISYEISKALGEKFNQPGYSWNGYVDAVYQDYFIYCMWDGNQRRTYRQEYAVENDSVELTGDPVEVEKVVSYREANSAITGNSEGGSEMAFDKKSHINALVANGVVEESQRDWLMKMPDEHLQRFKVPPKETTTQTTTNQDGGNGLGNSGKETVVVQNGDQTQTHKEGQNGNGKPKALTLNEYIETAPPPLRGPLRRMIANDENRKQELITKIKSDPRNIFKDDFLNSRELDELEGIAALSQRITTNEEEEESQVIDRTRVYYGAVGAPPTVTTNSSRRDEEDGILLPTVNNAGDEEDEDEENEEGDK